MTTSNPINISRIDHVVIRVNNLEAMIDWYCKVLGYRLERGPGQARLAQLRAGQSLLDLVDINGALGQARGGPPDQLAPNMDHLCLQVVPWDTEAIRDHLRRQQVEAGEAQQRYGARGRGPSMVLQDPEGNVIELKGNLQ